MSMLVEENDSLNGLEERILKAVELISTLKEENKSLREQLNAAETSAISAMAELETLQTSSGAASKELELLRAERVQVKSRIEKLLGQMDRLAES